MKNEIGKIAREYLGIGDDSNLRISFNFDTIEEFEKRYKNNRLENIFKHIFSEVRDVLRQRYRDYLKNY